MYYYSESTSNVFYVIVPVEAVKVTLIFTTLRVLFFGLVRKGEMSDQRRKIEIVPSSNGLISRIIPCRFCEISKGKRIESVWCHDYKPSK